MAIQTPSLELGAPLVQPTAAAAGRGYWKSVARRLRRDPVTVICAAVLLLLVASALAAPWLGLADPYKTSMLRRLYPLGSPNHLLGTDHPFPVLRVAELRDWVEQGGYDRILRGEYTRRGEEAQTLRDDIAAAGRAYGESARQTFGSAADAARRVVDSFRTGFNR